MDRISTPTVIPTMKPIKLTVCVCVEIYNIMDIQTEEKRGLLYLDLATSDLLPMYDRARATTHAQACVLAAAGAYSRWLPGC